MYTEAANLSASLRNAHRPERPLKIIVAGAGASHPIHTTSPAGANQAPNLPGDLVWEGAFTRPLTGDSGEKKSSIQKRVRGMFSWIW